jgi:uncharacterized membrane protein YkoI
MIKKTIITVVVIVAILGIAFAAYGNNNSKNSTNTTNSTSSGKVIVTVNNTTSNNNNNSQTNISPAEAQKIAKTFIQVSGATAGTPKLVNQDGTLMYIVPVINNNTSVGEIDIDANTGKNLGGAGGAP